ncbi:hypothetical protein NE237_008073 [Protea cynaroides]|uniref:Uncharacterized protein n=1 Tax=Protea cynaroides TaxID=273540 RepID=A0A9Q0KQQ1_9MAGN|nr:hypothetical protein NE237_008073 [Protea cynaroides]
MYAKLVYRRIIARESRGAQTKCRRRARQGNEAGTRCGGGRRGSGLPVPLLASSLQMKNQIHSTLLYLIHPVKPGPLKQNRIRPECMLSNQEKPCQNTSPTNIDYQPFKEEDYIVFCVNKDGTFDVVEDEKSESAYHVKYRTEPLRAVNRKLVYKEDTDTDSKYGDEDVSNEDGVDFDATNVDSDILTDVEGEYEDGIYFDSEAPHPRIRAEAYCKKVNDDDESGINSQESSFSTSTLSRSSTGSFAFPVLRCEWNGSPVKMPEPEGLPLRKHKSLCIGLQCCKF